MSPSGPGLFQDCATKIYVKRVTHNSGQTGDGKAAA